MKAIQDNKDKEILSNRVKTYNKIKGPRVGDFLFTEGGKLKRFTHDCGNSLQVADPEAGSYYLGDGYISYSGNLEAPIGKDKVEKTIIKKSGTIWFFHHNIQEANNGVYGVTMFRVFRMKKE